MAGTILPGIRRTTLAQSAMFTIGNGLLPLF
jgi:hypothetical protein